MRDFITNFFYYNQVPIAHFTIIWTAIKEILIFIVLIMAIRLMHQKLKENKARREQEQKQDQEE